MGDNQMLDLEQARQRVQELRTVIEKNNRLYYDQDAPELEDFEYDALTRELKELEAQGQADGGGRTARPEEENRTFGIEERLESDVCEKLRSVQMDMMTPLESLNLLYELKKMLS